MFKRWIYAIFGWAIKTRRGPIPYRWKAVLKYHGRKYKYNCENLSELITKLVQLNSIIK